MTTKSHWTLKSHVVGKRVEIPPHFDLWMRGARFGVIHSVSTNPNLRTVLARVHMDHPQVRKLAVVELNDLQFV